MAGEAALGGLRMASTGLLRSSAASSVRLFQVANSEMLRTSGKSLIYSAGQSLGKLKLVDDLHWKHGRTSSINVDWRTNTDFSSRVKDSVGEFTYQDQTCVTLLQQGCTAMATARCIDKGLFEDAAPLCFTMLDFIEPMLQVALNKPPKNWKMKLDRLPNYMPGVSSSMVGFGAHILEDFDASLEKLALAWPSEYLGKKTWGDSYGVVAPVSSITNSEMSKMFPFTAFKLMDCPVVEGAVWRARNRPYVKKYLSLREELELELPEGTASSVVVERPSDKVLHACQECVMMERAEIDAILEMGKKKFADVSKL